MAEGREATDAEGREPTDAVAERPVELAYRPTVDDLAAAIRTRAKSTRAGRFRRWLPANSSMARAPSCSTPTPSASM